MQGAQAGGSCIGFVPVNTSGSASGEAAYAKMHCAYAVLSSKPCKNMQLWAWVSGCWAVQKAQRWRVGVGCVAAQRRQQPRRQT